MKQQEIETAIQEQREDILRAQSKLSSLDYIGVKIATGVSFIEDYRDEIAEAERCRQVIRQATIRIAELETMEPEPEAM